jgi:putative membrane protein
MIPDAENHSCTRFTLEEIMYWGNHFWGMHMFWWIFWVALVASMAFWAWPTQTKRRDSALETLRRRYAAGEITEAEYRGSLAVLAEPNQADWPSRSAAGRR